MFVSLPSQCFIMKAFKCTEQLKVLSFKNYQCSVELHIFTDFTVNIRHSVIIRCHSLILRVSGYEDITRISIKKNKLTEHESLVEGWKSQTFNERQSE